jgi:hypothetical protein
VIKASRKDPTIKEMILAMGCPPTFKETTKIFEQCGIHFDMGAYQRLQYTLINRYQEKENNTIYSF